MSACDTIGEIDKKKPTLLDKRSKAKMNAKTKLSALFSFLSCLVIMGLYSLYAKPWQTQLRFDDAFMFTRYARNFQHGLGISWNLDGVHTYGMTSLPWMFYVLPFTRFLRAQAALQLASWSAATLALTAMSFGVSSASRSRSMSNPFVACAAVCLPLLSSGEGFKFQIFSGMDTAFAIAVNSVLIIGVMAWQRHPTTRRALLVGLVSFTATVVRPDGALCAIFVPYLAWQFQTKSKRLEDLGLLCGISALLIVLYLAACQLYFGSALPLSFYAKSAHGYVGFLNPESPLVYLGMFLTAAGLPCLIMLIGANRRDLGCYSNFIVPAMLTILYLLTVKQIMGTDGRFFFPLLPYFLVPGLLTLDRRLLDVKGSAIATTEISLVLTKLTVVGLFCLLTFATDQIRKKSIVPVERPFLPHSAKAHLAKLDWFAAIVSMSKIANRGMSGKGVIAASEVGYLGETLRNVDIVDLVGLNDSTIGRSGFSMDYLLSRKPDLIWFPHSDYTGLNAQMLSDPRLFREYEVLVEAFNYGVAIRKESHNYKKLKQSIKAIWPSLYPRDKFDSYVVTFG